MNGARNEQRVLVLAPTGTDAELVQSLLHQDGIACAAYPDIRGLCTALESGAAALLLAEESMFDADLPKLTDALGRQPSWSDLPVLLLTRHGADSPEVARALDTLGNVTLLERPTRVAALVSAVRSGLRARSRQYLLRSELAAREGAERLRRAELAVTQVLTMAGGAHDALEGILSVVCESLGWALGAVWEVSGDAVVCTKVWPETSAAYGGFIRASRTTRFARGVGLPGRVWVEGRPAWIPDVARDGNFPRAPFAIAAGLHSGFALPIRHGEQVVGVMEFLSPEIREPDPDLLGMMNTIGAYIGQVLENKRAEEALRERTDLLELANEAIVVRASDGTVPYWSQGAEGTYGWSAAEIVGRPMHETLQTRFPKKMERIEAALVRDGHWEGELIQVHKNGGEVVIDSRWALRRGEHGTQVSVLEINRDVTDRKRAEVALHETESRVRERAEELETLMDAVPAIVFVAHDVECRRITGNRAAYEFLHMRPGANLSITAAEGERPTHFRVFRAGAELAPGELPLQSAARGSPARGEELEIVFTDGQRRHLYGSAIPLTGGNGEPRGAIGSFLDITGRKRIEEALRQSERVYRGIGESIEYGVWVCDAEGRNVYASDSFLQMTGLTQQECAGFAWTELLHEKDREDTIASWKECVRSGIAWYREHRILGVDGKYHPVLARGVPVYDEEGALVCWAGTNLDIARLKEAQDSLREADRRKDEFLATLAHELRNPLAPIRTSVQVLRGLDLREPDFTWSRNVIERQTQHLTRLVDDLLDVSRITRGKVELRRERLLLADVVRSVLEATRALVQAAGHELRVVQPEEPIPLDADPVRLAQCLSNLLNNAVKYTPPGGHIDLLIEREGDKVLIQVRDDGIGIPASELTRVFEMFSQVDTALERAQGGLGIGLSIVKSFVELHGGTVEVRSDGPGRGSAFTIRLPVDTRNLELHPARRGGKGVTNGAAHRILVVDDNKDSAESLSIFLRRSGHEVHTVYDGEKAMQALAAFHPEVVVLDIGLPGLSGFEVARRMRLEPGGSSLLLIAATGWGQAEHLSRSREAGFDHHMVKPIDVLALQQLLAQP